MATTIKKIQSKRRVEKASISHALSFVQNPPSEFDTDQIETRLGRLDQAFGELKELTKELYDFEEDANFVDPDRDLEEYEEKYLMAKGVLKRMIGSVRTHVSTPEPTSDAFIRLAEQHSTLLQRLDSAVTTRHGDNDLPKIRIEPFSGQYKDWPAFKDLFTSAIDSKPNLTNTQKFHYLKSVLKDDAAKLIKHMQITESSYTTAWERLKERFDRPRHIVNSYIETFMSLSSLKEENSVGLRKISDISNEVIKGLEAIDFTERDHWLIYILQNKIDPDSRRKWIENTRDESKPTITTFLTFLDQRCEEIELVKNPEKRLYTKSTGFKNNSTTTLVATNDQQKCVDCRLNEHFIHKCPHFLSVPVEQRRVFVREKSLCFNCLKGGHTAYNCKSQHKCRTCQRNHHSLLHNLQAVPANGQVNNSHATNVVTSDHEVSQQISSKILVLQPNANFLRKPNTRKILPTALVSVRNSKGEFVICRVLLDTASELSYITEDYLKRLGLPRNSSRISLSGIQAIRADPTRGHTSIHMKSRFSEDSLNTFAHVIGRISASIPRSTITDYDPSLFEKISLADPYWYRSAPVDILLGADEVWEILLMEKLRNDQGKIIAVSTSFGWVVTSGSFFCPNHVSTSLLTLVDLDHSIRAFWEIEECPTTTKLDDEALIVEHHFKDTHKRHTDGKYIVELPFKEQNIKFAETYKGALNRFNSTERRLSGNPDLKSQYTKFMQEYHSLGHMRELSPNEIDVEDNSLYYLPHHPIVGAKLRVVFFKMPLVFR